MFLSFFKVVFLLVPASRCVFYILWTTGETGDRLYQSLTPSFRTIEFCLITFLCKDIFSPQIPYKSKQSSTIIVIECPSPRMSETLYNKKWNRKTMFCRLGYSYFQTERENDKKRLSEVKVKIRLLTWKNSQGKIDRPCTNTHLSHVHTHTHTDGLSQWLLHILLMMWSS